MKHVRGVSHKLPNKKKSNLALLTTYYFCIKKHLIKLQIGYPSSIELYNLPAQTFLISKQQPIAYPHDWPGSDLSRNILLLRSVTVWFLHISASSISARRNNAPLYLLVASRHFHTLLKQVKSEESTLNMEQLWHDSPLNNKCKNEHSAQLSVKSFGF